MMREFAVLMIVFNLFAFNKANAQTARAVSGLLKDSSGTVIHGANLQLAAGKDTLYTISNKDGRYTFKGIKTGSFSLVITSVGYSLYSGNYQFKQDQTMMEIEPVIMKPELHQLEDVVVKSVIVPVTVKQDTVEYDARAYLVREGDMVEELLKQLPGIEVDKDGNVKAQGKEMTRLRVNGKDFFTNDVTTFIKQLPANIISKLQVIEDYGEEAEFTGIKKGEPKKMLNLVTKPGMNKGIFGNAGARAATSGTYGLNGGANVWRDNKQISANINLNNANNNNLVSTSSGAALSYRDNWSKKIVVNADYNYSSNQRNSTGNLYRETIYPFGTIYTNTSNTASSKNKGHNLNLGMHYEIARATYLTINGGINYNDGTNNSASISNQTGALMQDLQNVNYSQQTSPNIFATAFFGHRFKKSGRVLSAGVNLNGSKSENEQQIKDHVLYYDSNTSAMVKDSLLERLVLTHNKSRIIGMNISYSEPLSERKRLDVSYSYNSSLTDNSLLTNVSRSPGKYDYIDSLSNISQYAFLNHRINLSYRYTSKKLNYSAGINAQPNSTKGEYTGRKESIHYSTLNFSPTAHLSVTLSKKSSLNMGYNGQSSAPNINQLQPVADSRNLQNIIVGNPDLKPSFNHQYNFSYNNRYSDKGAMFMLAFNGSAVKNQVVANVLLIRDSVLGSLKQETHFKNANGAYNLGASYNLSQPLFNRKLNVNINGRVSKAKNISYADNVKNYRSSLNISQTLNMGMNLKWMDFSSGVQYSNYQSRYTLQNRTTNIVTWQFTLANSIFLSKTFGIGYDVSKQINSGYYSSISNNPLYINAHANLNMFKRKTANLRLQFNDILNQGISPARYISENSITDSRTNVITRYLLLSFNMRLNRFGKRE